MKPRPSGHEPSKLGLARALSILAAALVAGSGGPALSQPASEWVAAHESRIRLLSGTAARPGKAVRLWAGIEITLAEGWKTYWRFPGDSGVPPSFDWSQSVNAGAIGVHYPAPRRFTDQSGDTVGYKSTVVLPVEVTPADPAKPVKLSLAIEYGVCREICIPVEAKLAIVLPAKASEATASPAIERALAALPRRAADALAGDPEFVRVAAETSGNPRLVVEALVGKGREDADLFVEAPDGLFLALPRKVAASDGNVVRFEIDLSKGSSAAELADQTLRLTLVSGGGATETTWTFRTQP